MNSGLKESGLNTVTTLLAALVVSFMAFDGALAGGGPLGIDRALTYDDSGIWKRSDQLALLFFCLNNLELDILPPTRPSTLSIPT